MPRVSVLVPNYNYGLFLGECLQSIKEQTFTDYEVIVADDGSTDNSADVIAAYRAFITRVVTGPNVGLAKNLARGLEQCRGEMIAFTSADDRWLPNHLAVGVAALDAHPEAALSYSFWQQIDVHSNPLPISTLR